jgi:hypothetical protein
MPVVSVLCESCVSVLAPGTDSEPATMMETRLTELCSTDDAIVLTFGPRGVRLEVLET